MNIKDIFNKFHKQKDQVKFGIPNDANNADDQHDEDVVLNLIDEFRNEHYNHSINTLQNDLKLVQDTISDLQKDIQTIKEFIVTYKTSNPFQCNNNENENILDFLKKDNKTENVFSTMNFGANDDEMRKELALFFKKIMEKKEKKY